MLCGSGRGYVACFGALHLPQLQRHPPAAPQAGMASQPAAQTRARYPVRRGQVAPATAPRSLVAEGAPALRSPVAGSSPERCGHLSSGSHSSDAWKPRRELCRPRPAAAPRPGFRRRRKEGGPRQPHPPPAKSKATPATTSATTESAAPATATSATPAAPPSSTADRRHQRHRPRPRPAQEQGAVCARQAYILCLERHRRCQDRNPYICEGLPRPRRFPEIRRRAHHLASHSNKRGGCQQRTR